MVESTKIAFLVNLTTPATNKILSVNDYRSLCILSKLASQVAYRNQKVARDRKRSQYLKSSYVDSNNIRKRVENKNDIKSQYGLFKTDPICL